MLCLIQISQTLWLLIPQKRTKLRFQVLFHRRGIPTALLSTSGADRAKNIPWFVVKKECGVWVRILGLFDGFDLGGSNLTLFGLRTHEISLSPNPGCNPEGRSYVSKCLYEVELQTKGGLSPSRAAPAPQVPAPRCLGCWVGARMDPGDRGPASPCPGSPLQGVAEGVRACPRGAGTVDHARGRQSIADMKKIECGKEVSTGDCWRVLRISVRTTRQAARQ